MASLKATFVEAMAASRPQTPLTELLPPILSRSNRVQVSPSPPTTGAPTSAPASASTSTTSSSPSSSSTSPTASKATPPKSTSKSASSTSDSCGRLVRGTTEQQQLISSGRRYDH